MGVLLRPEKDDEDAVQLSKDAVYMQSAEYKEKVTQV